MKDWNPPDREDEDFEEEAEETDEDKAFEAYAERIRNKLEYLENMDCDEPKTY